MVAEKEKQKANSKDRIKKQRLPFTIVWVLAIGHPTLTASKMDKQLKSV